MSSQKSYDLQGGGDGSSRIDQIARDFEMTQVNDIRAVQQKKAFDKRRELIAKQKKIYKEAKESGQKIKVKIENVLWTNLKASALEADKSAVSNPLKYLKPDHDPRNFAFLADSTATNNLSLDMESATEEDVLQEKAFLIVADEVLYKQIMDFEEEKGISSSKKGNKFLFTQQEDKKLGDFDLRDGLPLVAYSSVIAFKRHTYIPPANKSNDIARDHPSIIRFETMLNNMERLLKKNKKHLKRRPGGILPAFAQSAMSKMTEEERKNFVMAADVRKYGPKILFKYDKEKGCDIEGFKNQFGSPKDLKPGVMDAMIPSNAALENNKWDQEIPVKFKDRAICVSPSETIQVRGENKNMAQYLDPDANHHMEDVVKMKKKYKPDNLSDAQIMRDMITCSTGSSLQNNPHNFDTCASNDDITEAYSGEKVQRKNKCRKGTEADGVIGQRTCFPRWMTDPKNPLYKLYNDDGKFADTEIANQTRNYKRKTSLEGVRGDDSDGSYATRYSHMDSVMSEQSLKSALSKVGSMNGGARDAYLSNMIKRG